MVATIGPLEVAVLVVVIVLLFGSRRVVAGLRSLKEGGRELKRGLTGEDEPQSQGEGSGESEHMLTKPR